MLPAVNYYKLFPAEWIYILALCLSKKVLLRSECVKWNEIARF